MEHSQYYKNYKLFPSEDEITAPFEYCRTLSNGVVIARVVDEEKYELTIEEIVEYIKENHKEILENE